jgi:ribosome-associated heat shock protein Hsp15
VKRDASPAVEALRIDKWLWCARFFKSRSLAAEAVAGGKVHLNAQRVKPARTVQAGDVLDITLGFEVATVKVTAIPVRRGPAAEARLCYEETPESLARRERYREQRRLAAMAAPQTEGRPDKRTRRELLRFHRRQGES